MVLQWRPYCIAINANRFNAKENSKKERRFLVQTKVNGKPEIGRKTKMSIEIAARFLIVGG
jgi:hypothetical protein